jgi:hypothetical protein
MVADIPHEIHVVGDHDKSFDHLDTRMRGERSELHIHLPIWILPERKGSPEFEILPDCFFPGDHCSEGSDFSDKSGFT